MSLAEHAREAERQHVTARDPGTWLLERTQILRELDYQLGRAARGYGQLVLLHGETGVGKTTVVRHFSQTARTRARVLNGACDPLTTPGPLEPLVDIASGLGRAGDEAPEQMSPLGLDGLSFVWTTRTDQVLGTMAHSCGRPCGPGHLEHCGHPRNADTIMVIKVGERCPWQPPGSNLGYRDKLPGKRGIGP
jgi:AAA ATPase domain